MVKLTIRDIALLAGVSKSTVSLVLNKSSKVDPATRKRVLQVMHEHKYVPSVAATSLAKGQTRLIGMIVPGLSWQLVADINVGVAQILERTPYDIILYSSTAEKDYSDVVERILSTPLTVGFVAVMHDHNTDPLTKLYTRGTPVVGVNTLGSPMSFPWVEANNYAGAYAAVRYLIDLGHRRIGFIQGQLSYVCCQQRYLGYCDALAEAGLPLDPTLVKQGDLTSAGAYECAHEFFSLPERPTALFASNDVMAYRALSAAAERNLRVPQDVSIIGFDDISPSALMHPALTTVRQPFDKMGQCAAEMMLSLLNPEYPYSGNWQEIATFYNYNASAPTSYENASLHFHIQLATNLVIRESCCPPAQEA